MGPRLDGPHRDVEPLRSFFLGVSQKVHVLQNVTFIGWQLPNRKPNLPFLPRTLDRGWQDGDLPVLEFDNGVPPLSAIHIDRNASSDRVQPRSNIAVRIDTIRCLPRLDERLLCSLFGMTSVPEDLHGDPENRTTVPPVDLANRRLIALDESNKEATIIDEGNRH